VIAVLYHSINGIRITLIDFFPKLTRQIRLISLTSTGLFLLSTLAVTVVMLKQTWDLLQK
jgi:succinate dehydrogenase/fumarate reductase cytochrome b subunit